MNTLGTNAEGNIKTGVTKANYKIRVVDAYKDKLLANQQATGYDERYKFSEKRTDLRNLIVGLFFYV